MLGKKKKDMDKNALNAVIDLSDISTGREENNQSQRLIIINKTTKGAECV